MSLQDTAVTVIAIGAVGLLAWRWFKSRSRPADACASCQPAEVSSKKMKSA